MKKITSLSEVVKISKKLRGEGKTVGLIVGSFDVLHMGHINLFHFAKKRSDVLIVGLDHDKTIKKTKGAKRPVNNYRRRSSFLAELPLVDHVFKIEAVYKHGDEKSFIHMKKLYKAIEPDFVFTSINCDTLWRHKRKMAKSLGIKFMPNKSKRITHTTKILKILGSEL